MHAGWPTSQNACCGRSGKPPGVASGSLHVLGLSSRLLSWIRACIDPGIGPGRYQRPVESERTKHREPTIRAQVVARRRYQKAITPCRGTRTGGASRSASAVSYRGVRPRAQTPPARWPPQQVGRGQKPALRRSPWAEQRQGNGTAHDGDEPLEMPNSRVKRARWQSSRRRTSAPETRAA